MDVPSTEPLWLTQPRRTTALATVTRARGDRFALDRSLFAPTSTAHRHPQPHDRGTVWVEGAKRILISSFYDKGILWHRLRGAVPPVGAQANCQLDQDRRQQTSAAHTAMHLMVAALQRAGGPPLASDPTVKLGGTFRLDLAAPYVAPKDLAAWLAQANQWIRDGRKVTVEHVTRGLEERVLDRQVFQPPDPYPGPPDTLTAVRIEGVACYPCDGTHVAWTRDVGTLQVAQAQPSGGGFVVVGRVRPA